MDFHFVNTAKEKKAYISKSIHSSVFCSTECRPSCEADKVPFLAPSTRKKKKEYLYQFCSASVSFPPPSLSYFLFFLVFLYDKLTIMAPTTLIIDTDPGIDDILAIVLALDRPDLVQLKAITLTFGNTTLDHCRNNIIQLFNILQKHIAEDPSETHRAKLAKTLSSSPITLSQGATGPLGGQRFTASYFHGRDGVSGITKLPGNPWPLPEKVPEPLRETEKAAHDVILETIRNNPPGTVRIAAVGPLTNIALAWQKDPETLAKCGGISVMGAALDVPGNVTTCAEFNTFADPFAVRELLHNAPLHPVLRKYNKRLPIDLLPLDITTQHLVPFERLCSDRVEKKGILQK